MATADAIYLAFIVVVLLVDHFVLWPAFGPQSQADPGRSRRRLWSSLIIMLWTLVAPGVALWLFQARSWAALGFVSPHGWRLWGAIGVVLALAVAFARPAIKLARSKRPRRIKMGGPHVESLAPHTTAELVVWVALSLSAGFCEEFIFRGYLIWVFQPLLGWWGAAALSAVAFAVAHSYQGVKGMLRVGIVGVLFTLVVLIFGSLWPAIVLHALLDLSQGALAWLALRQVRSEATPVPA